MIDHSDHQRTNLSSRRVLGGWDHLARRLVGVGMVFDAAPIGVAAWSVEGALVHANPVLCDLVGRSRDDLIGASFWSFVDPGDESPLRRRVTDLWEGRCNHFLFRFRCRRPGGAELWLACQLFAVYGADGRPDYLLSQILSFDDIGASVAPAGAARHRRGPLDLRRLFETVTEAGPMAVARTDAAGRVVYSNGRWSDLLDDAHARLAGFGWRSVLHRNHVDEIMRLAGVAFETGEPRVARVRIHDASIPIRRAGEGIEGRYWVEVRLAPVTTETGAPDGFVVTAADVSVQVAEGWRSDRLAQVFDAGSDYVLIVERNGAISYANQAAEEGLGVRSVSAPAEQAHLMDVLEVESFLHFHEVVEPVLIESRRWTGELTMRDREGQDVTVSTLVLAHANEAGRIETISLVARDISDLKQAQWRMRQLATHDYLTGLPNRVLLYERLDVALARFHRLDQTVALLYLDLDGFKSINDGLGHHVGDAVLVELADRIHATVRDIDTPARIGGDEFALLVEGFDDLELLENVAGRLIEAISQPIDVDGTFVQVGVSIGIVAADEACVDADALLARADAAMYEAKASGRGRFVMAARAGS